MLYLTPVHIKVSSCVLSLNLRTRPMSFLCFTYNRMYIFTCWGKKSCFDLSQTPEKVHLVQSADLWKHRHSGIAIEQCCRGPDLCVLGKEDICESVLPVFKVEITVQGDCKKHMVKAEFKDEFILMQQKNWNSCKGKVLKIFLENMYWVKTMLGFQNVLEQSWIYFNSMYYKFFEVFLYSCGLLYT